MMSEPPVAPVAPVASPLKLRSVFAIPVAVSLGLSAATVGTHAHWQDSGLYLSAVKEFVVLYPHGFMLYLILCKAWTLLLGFLDFTLAVHLFSSVCAALAAGFLALASERLRVDRAASAIAGTLAAAGYTWWFSGIYAKVYALYFLIIALLLWRMACRDPHLVIPILGLAWAAHPSAALLGPALLVYLWMQRSSIRLPRLLLAAAASLVCALGPSLFLPLLAAKQSPLSLGNPRTLGEVARYVAGSRFVSIRGVWGFGADRWLRVGRFALEEFLLVGGGLVAAGFRALFRERRRDALFLVAWCLPILIVLPLFKIEGQDDLWLVVVWMPLWIVAAAGLTALKARAPWLPGAACAAGLACAVAMNGRDLCLRNETLPESWGKSILQNLDPGAVLVLNSDDSLGLCRYLQVVRGYRSDVHCIVLSYVQPGAEWTWYLDALRRVSPDSPKPNFDSVSDYAATYTNVALSQAAIINGCRPGGPAIYFDAEPPVSILNSGRVLPAGFLWKWTEKEGEGPDPRAWKFPVTLEEVAARSGRKRGQHLWYLPDSVEVASEAYERRLLSCLALARRNLAGLILSGGAPGSFAQSASIYESILKADPESARNPEVLYPLGLDYYMLDRYAEANDLFERLLREHPEPSQKAGALFYLGELCRMLQRDEEAKSYYRRALDAAPAASKLRPELEKRLAPGPR
jgi:hypothetical protein